MIELPVLFLTWNRLSYSQQSLSTLLSNPENIRLHIFIIDSFSTDGTRDWIIDLPMNLVTTEYNTLSINRIGKLQHNIIAKILLQENLGISGAMNLFVQETKDKYNHPYIAKLDNDSIVQPFMFSKLLEKIQKHKLACISALSPLNVWKGQKQLTWEQWKKEYRVIEKGLYSVPFVGGSGVIIDRNQMELDSWPLEQIGNNKTSGWSQRLYLFHAEKKVRFAIDENIQLKLLDMLQDHQWQYGKEYTNYYKQIDKFRGQLKEKIRLVVWPSDTQGQGWHRALLPAYFLNHCSATFEIKIIPWELKTSRVHIDKLKQIWNWADICLCSRWGSQIDLELWESSPKPKKVYDIDDNIFCIPKWNPVYRIYKNPMLDRIRQMLKEAELVTVSTSALKEEYKKFNKKIEILPNSIDPRILEWEKINQHKTRINKRVRLGWVGTASHLKDIDIVKDALIEVLKQYSNDVVFTFFGAIPTWHIRLPMQAYDVEQRFMFEDFHEKLWELDWDFAIAPLDGHKYNNYKCVTGDTRIVTRNGLIKIINLSPNAVMNKQFDKFCKLKIELDDGNFTSHYYYGGKQKTLKIKTYLGYELEGSLFHRIKDNKNEWVELQNLKIGDIAKLTPFEFAKDYVTIKYPLLQTRHSRVFQEEIKGNSMPQIIIDENWGRLLGYCIGDGHLSKVAIKISCNKEDQDVIEDVQNLFYQIGLNSYTSQKKRFDKTLVNCIDVIASSRHFIDFLERQEISKKKGGRYEGKGRIESRRNLLVPEIIFKSPKSVVKEFLRGLFEADGCPHKGDVITLSSKSEQLIKDIQLLLLGFGITCKVTYSIYKTNQKDFKNYNGKIYWKLCLRKSEKDIFEKEIGFVSQRKKNRLHKFMWKGHCGRYSAVNFEDKIVKITEGEQEVFDITIPTNQIFIGNGFINHNSNLKILDAGSLGVPTIASDLQPYSEHYEKHQDVLLIHGNDTQNWVNTLSSVIECLMKQKQYINQKDNDEEFVMDSLSKKAYQTVKEHYNWAENWKLWEKAYSSL